MQPFFDRLKQRRVVQWALAYLAIAVPVWSVVEVLGDRWGLTPGAGRALDVMLVVGLLLTLVLGWYHGEKGRQRVGAVELVLVSAILGLGTLGVLVWGPGAELPQDSSGGGAEAERPLPNAVAILPFGNRSVDGSEGAAFFAEGLHDELLVRMSKLSGVAVIGRTSVMRYAGADRPPAQTIADELGARVLVDGSVIQAGERLRMNVQLIDGETGAQILADQWDEVYSVRSALEVLSGVAARIVEALETSLAPGEEEALEALPTQDSEAYLAFLEGRTLAGRNRQEEAHAAYERAVALDPDFPEAWAAMVWPLFLQRGGSGSATIRHARAAEAVERAERLAPDAPETLYARASFVYFSARDYAEAERLLAQIEARWPGNTDALLLRGVMLKRQGRFAECADAMERLGRRDPANGDVFVELQICNRYLGRAVEAARAVDRAIALNPTNEVLVNARFFIEVNPKGDTAAARSYMEANRHRSSSSWEWALWFELFRGDYELILDTLLSRGWTATTDFQLAQLYHLAGMSERGRAAADSLATAIEERDVLAVGESERQLDLARAHFLRGDVAAAEAGIRRAEELLEQYPDALIGVRIPYNWALYHRERGDYEQALARLEEFWELARLPSPEFLSLDPTWAPLHDDPRFQALVARYRVN